MRDLMTFMDFNARAELYLGSDRNTALEQGPRTFRTAAQALSFAFEQAAPVSLRGASLKVGNRSYLAHEHSAGISAAQAMLLSITAGDSAGNTRQPGANGDRRSENS